MASLTISETQARKCVEALELTADFAAKHGDLKVSRDCRDVAAQIRLKLQRVDAKMRARGKRP